MPDIRRIEFRGPGFRASGAHGTGARGMGARGTGRRRAASLIELLVVVTIVLLVTGIAIRAVTPAVEARQLREGARQFNVFVNSARNRAIATGRPMGFWIDRLAGVPEAGISVSYAQVPEPYSGDYADSGAEAFVVGDSKSSAKFGYQRYVNIVRAFAASSASYGGNQVLYDFWCL
ncbi:MAG TPA: hypothetical protein VHY37_05975, partial [Tepidisphaeraceae bacterium]|nr:hypothetical protein [Tepidisphaeraceae bacterium]